ncbi:heat-shock protein [Campylobacter mucosalis]|uniref:rRNA maturation RNase YbeY n=1 Tax=Campylobacter mucosalis TaxID=202 RepID=UPI0004D53860|nr:rRNA maturation RNase YbeY [Campylobacter mucosalis]KEA46248.1 heat-shock protein [Campylobacter mucosalis]QKF62708.1 rRNA maturation RNase [Campylobacter mucosalis]
MILCDEKYPEILDQICEFLTPGEVELSFVNEKQMKNINKTERNIDKTTDVLSFPFEYIPHTPLGCVVINTDLVRQKAIELGHTEDDETALLFTHGLLHVLGYDHEKDRGEMRAKEEEVILKFKLPKSLIVRTLES